MEFEARTPAFYFYCNLSKVPPFILLCVLWSQQAPMR